MLLSLGPAIEKTRFLQDAKMLQGMGLALYATPGTYDVLREHGIACEVAYKNSDNQSPAAVQLMNAGKIDLVINIPRSYDREGRPDGYFIRRRAVDLNIPLITNMQLARAVVEAIEKVGREGLEILDWQSYLERRTQLLA